MLIEHDDGPGDARAPSAPPTTLDEIFPVVYDELRRLAQHYLRRERPGHTLQTTALVHEAYIRLAEQRRIRWDDRAHFFGAAAQTMRRILVNHARARGTAKRGGAAVPLTLDAAANVAMEGSDAELLALDDALTRLAALDARQARVVELRYFAGLSIDETADVLGTSPATVKREWNTAKAWLRRAVVDG